VITRDVPAHAFVAGNPAKVRGWVCECGDRLADDLTCACGKAYHTAGDGLVAR
jgi:serine acetyltransferase